jgi:hypothetical protein
MVVRHDKSLIWKKSSHSTTSLIRRFAVQIPARQYWETELSEKGIQISKMWGGNIALGWSAIKSIDHFGLLEGRPLDFGFDALSRAQQEAVLGRRFFRVMLADNNIVTQICRHTPGKTKIFTKNVFAIENIAVECVPELNDGLIAMAKLDLLRFDTLVGDFK